ncbi:uncharacterized protein LOC142564955 [Dermacentor variabilis]|uniref:uncharacterized protein LOC142564955 n=1 Tax=Dermacentor variabilis TaxID=34621 RepID=UPI003F5BB093
MLIILLFLCMMTAASAAKRNKGRYEESPKHYNEQKLSAMADVTETLFVIERNYKINTSFRCLSAKKVRALDGKKYEYRLKARSPDGNYFNYTVKMIAKKTGGHRKPNAVLYQEDPEEKNMTHKIVTMNNKHSCFVLVRDSGKKKNKKDCFLARTQRTAKKRIYDRCKRVFNNYCGGKSIRLYHDDCEA